MKIVIDIQGLDTLSLSMEQARELYNDLKAVFDKEIKPPYIDLDQWIKKQDNTGRPPWGRYPTVSLYACPELPEGWAH